MSQNMTSLRLPLAAASDMRFTKGRKIRTQLVIAWYEPDETWKI